MKNARRAAAFAVASSLLAAVLLAPGCGGSPKLSKPDLRGRITSMKRLAGGSGAGAPLLTMLVEGEVEKDTSIEVASVRVTGATKVYSSAAGSVRQVTFESLEVGQRVEVTFEGPVAESYPVQGTAGQVVILEDGDIEAVKLRHEAEIMAIDGVAGIGIGEKDGSPCITVFLENDSPDLRARIPAALEGYPVVIQVTGVIKPL